MGFLDKILNGTKKESGITDELNKVAQNKNQRLIDGEEEKEERMRLGQDIEPYYIGESRRNGFPYDCFFEWEYEMVETGLNAKDTLDGTLRIIQCAREYALANEKLDANTRLKFFNKNHSKFWVEKLIEKANAGSVFAKAAFSGKNFDSTPELLEMVNNMVDETVKAAYLEDVIQACNCDNSKAILAYAFFMLRDEENRDKQKNMYLKAGQLGSSEAYNELFFSVKNHWNAEEGFKYAVAAAECNDGEKAYFFQGKIGDAYYYGDGWNIDIDKAEGLRWYKRSAANGYGGAIRTLEMLQRNGEI